MSKFYLVIVDTTGIQQYIFGSNRLRENVGASHLVFQATQGWLFDAPNDFLPKGKHNLIGRKRCDDMLLEQGGIDAELLYAGGGNTVLMFRDPNDVKRFGRALSSKLISEAPGLNVVMVSHAFDWSESLVDVMKQAMSKLSETKQKRQVHQMVLGLGVTAACQSTALAANYNFAEKDPDTEEETRWTISAEVQAKRDNNQAAKDRLKEYLVALPKGFTYPDDFDDLGRSRGDMSYIGVVHADGNSMGEKLRKIANECAGYSGDENRKYIRQMREFSDQVDQAGLLALRKVVEAVIDMNQSQDESKALLTPGKAKQPKKDGSDIQYLSIRPIVYGGDDVTFVCDGRIALQAAQIFLETFAQQEILGEKGIAGAGVAIVKVRYPFARAYLLAEQLTKNAKNEYKRQKPALDWHLAQSGLFGSLEEIRRREYYAQDSNRTLLMRPLITSEDADQWRTWSVFRMLVGKFGETPQRDGLSTPTKTDKEPSNTWPRNKLLTLRSALRDALEQKDTPVQSFVSAYKLLPEVKIIAADCRNVGWNGEHCVYYDAIEMIDQIILKATPSGGDQVNAQEEKNA